MRPGAPAGLCRARVHSPERPGALSSLQGSLSAALRERKHGAPGALPAHDRRPLVDGPPRHRPLGAALSRAGARAPLKTERLAKGVKRGPNLLWSDRYLVDVWAMGRRGPEQN